jgi:hypothetical protein
MPKRYDDKLHLDMPFGEALERYAFTDPKEMEANIKKAKKKKPPGGRKSPPSGEIKQDGVVSLRSRRRSPEH